LRGLFKQGIFLREMTERHPEQKFTYPQIRVAERQSSGYHFRRPTGVFQFIFNIGSYPGIRQAFPGMTFFFPFRGEGLSLSPLFVALRY
jgi:hypothetical protein